MMRHQQRKAARRSGSGLSREIDLPLPLRGIRSELKNAEFTGMFAAELFNLSSDGTSLSTPQNYIAKAGGGIGSIPFEFGTEDAPIIVFNTGLQRGDVTYPGEYESVPSFAYISNNAIISVPGQKPVRYDGSTFTTTDYTTEDVDVTTLNGLIAHQDRLFFWERGGPLNFYFGGVGAVTGELAEFPLGRLGNITGTMLAMKSLTVDAGDGLNDTLAIFTSTGQIIVYEGTNPADAADWRQQSRIKVAPVISEDAFVEIGTDLWMLTAAGVLSVQRSLSQGAAALVDTISEAIQDELVDLVAEGGEWSMHLSADARSVIINRVFNGESRQFIFNTKSKSWSTTSYPARHWRNEGLQTKFTTLSGQNATLSKDGESATFTCKWVTSWFRLPRSTGITYMRPTILAKGPMTVKVIVLSDHDGTADDIAESEQELVIEPDDPDEAGGQVALNEIIAVDAVGDVFQMTIEVEAKWAQLVNVKVALM